MTELPGLILLSLRAGLFIALYLFLFWAVRIIWKDFQQARASAAEEHISPLILVIQHNDEEVSHVLINPEYMIGRSPKADIHIPDETVSSEHARVFYDHKRWWLEDLGSSNGTYLNELPLDQPVVLADQDLIRLGKITSQIQIPETQSYEPGM